MTLLELLVKELPELGGWPDGAISAVHYPRDRYAWFLNSDGTINKSYPAILSEVLTDKNTVQQIDRKFYEAALAASQQPVWDGEGLPPVGVECEITAHNNRWVLLGGSIYKGSVIAYSGEEFWFKAVDGTSTITRTDKVDFRPIRTEAESKREEVISKIQSHAHVDYIEPISAGQAIALYDAIAAGKIPGVKLDIDQPARKGGE